jgi:gliding motility-associated lipoprotein GldH
MKRALYFLLPALLLLACDSSKIYQRYEDLPGNVWTRDKEITFTVDIQDVNPSYDVMLAVRHSSYYTWANLKLQLTCIYPSGETRTSDQEFLLRNADGSFRGEGAGDLWDIEFPWYEKVKFTEKGTYTFKVNNAMPRLETEDIMQIGLIVRKSS